VPQVVTEDATLHVEIDGEGEPVTVLAHGLTNTCKELAQLTPLFPGTKVRFCFRGHGHSSAPASGYGFADLARDVDAVATEYGAQIAVGTSVGQGAICRLLQDQPDRFERMLFILPVGIDHRFEHKEQFVEVAEILENKPPQEAVEAILNHPERLAGYTKAPWLREMDRMLWADANTIGLARAIREIIEDVPLVDGEVLRRVQAPVMLIARDGDPIHPAVVGERLSELFSNAELHLYPDEVSLFEAMPFLVMRAYEFLYGGSDPSLG
jgi:pimeloyl-ACP methyl ester carboxylesterase